VPPGLDPTQVLAQVAMEVVDNAGEDWSRLPAGALTEHIEAVHHQYLFRELPELGELAAKVAAVHSARHLELPDVLRLVEELQAYLLPHTAEEEGVLFPAIRALQDGPATSAFGSIANPIGVMTVEHENVGELLRRLDAVTSHYQVPADGCTSYQPLYQRLEALEVG
jgi:regulator of cell morphogenesis and NO signaling